MSGMFGWDKKKEDDRQDSGSASPDIEEEKKEDGDGVGAKDASVEGNRLEPQDNDNDALK